jgi:threonine dehydratase
MTEINRAAIDKVHAVIAPHVRETPVLVTAAEDFGLAGAPIAFKLELLQHAGSFKPRGAFANLLTRTVPKAGVVAASGGNHGAAVAFAARRLGIPAKIFIPTVASPAKIAQIRSYGAELVVEGARYADALALSQDWAAKSGALQIHAFDQPETMLGQGTVAREFAAQAPQATTWLVAVGGGGLIGGIGSYVKATRPEVEVVGCWPENSPVMWECMQAGRVVDVAERPTLSESTAGGLEPGTVTLDVCRRVIDRAVFVTEDEIRDAMRLVLRTEHWLVEGAAAVAVAGFRKAGGRNAAIVLCGRNLSAEAFNLVF